MAFVVSLAFFNPTEIKIGKSTKIILKPIFPPLTFHDKTSWFHNSNVLGINVINKETQSENKHSSFAPKIFLIKSSIDSTLALIFTEDVVLKKMEEVWTSIKILNKEINVFLSQKAFLQDWIIDSQKGNSFISTKKIPQKFAK